jgi:hypothetical protein
LYAFALAVQYDRKVHFQIGSEDEFKSSSENDRLNRYLTVSQRDFQSPSSVAPIAEKLHDQEKVKKVSVSLKW